MAKLKKTFIFYNDRKDYVDQMTKEEAWIFLKAILAYQNWDPPQIEWWLKFIWGRIQKQLDEDNQKREEEIEKRRIAGKNWGLARARNMKQNEASATNPKQVLQKNEKFKQIQADNVNDNVNENDNNLINSSNEEFNENKNNKLNKTTSLKKIEEEKKEKSSAKKEKNAEIRERNTKILELIKQKVESLGLIYKAWEMERISATNICTAKVFGSVAEKFWLSPPELAIAVIEASAQDQFRAGKIYNAETVYKHYEKVINQAKASFQKKQNQIAKVKRV